MTIPSIRLIYSNRTVIQLVVLKEYNQSFYYYLIIQVIKVQPVYPMTFNYSLCSSYSLMWESEAECI